MKGVWVALSILTAITLAMFTMIVSMSSNRFTSHDGLNLIRDLGDLKAEVACLPKIVPPPQFELRVAVLEAAILRCEEKFDVVIKQLTILQAKMDQRMPTSLEAMNGTLAQRSRDVRYLSCDWSCSRHDVWSKVMGEN